MLACWPGHIQPGTISDHISAFWDVLPSFCEIADVPIPGDADGISFLPALLGETQIEHEYLYWEFPAYKGQQAVRMGKWKAIRKNIFDGNMDIELYNLETDLREQHNIATEYPDIIEKMRNIMLNSHTPSSLFPLFESERN